MRQSVSSQCSFSFIYYGILLMSRFLFHCQQWLVREGRSQSGEEEKLRSIQKGLNPIPLKVLKNTFVTPPTPKIIIKILFFSTFL